jgi:hypothetical protein
MRKLLFILFILSTVAVSAQKYTPFYTYGNAFQRIKADSVLNIPEYFTLDTLYHTNDTSAQARIIAGDMWFYSKLLHKWIKSGTGAVGDIFNHDTTILQTIIDSTGQQWHRVLFAGPNYKITSSSQFLFNDSLQKLVIGDVDIAAGGDYGLYIDKGVLSNGPVARVNGTATQFLKADGSLDSTRYLRKILGQFPLYNVNDSTIGADTAQLATTGRVKKVADSIIALIPAPFNPIPGKGISITGTYPSMTFTATDTASVVIDTGRAVTQVTTGYDLNKVRDSVAALIPTDYIHNLFAQPYTKFIPLPATNTVSASLNKLKADSLYSNWIGANNIKVDNNIYSPNGQVDNFTVGVRQNFSGVVADGTLQNLSNYFYSTVPNTTLYGINFNAIEAASSTGSSTIIGVNSKYRTQTYGTDVFYAYRAGLGYGGYPNQYFRKFIGYQVDTIPNGTGPANQLTDTIIGFRFRTPDAVNPHVWGYVQEGTNAINRFEGSTFQLPNIPANTSGTYSYVVKDGSGNLQTVGSAGSGSSGGTTVEQAAAFSAINTANTTTRIIEVAADETNGGKTTYYAFNNKVTPNTLERFTTTTVSLPNNNNTAAIQTTEGHTLQTTEGQTITFN